jgi:AraC family transcriptional regulator
MFLRFELLDELKLIGMNRKMSFLNITTPEIWKKFMPRKNEISSIISSDLYSLEVYPVSFFSPYDPSREFTKWTAVAVRDLKLIPAEMESLIVPAGLYAVFLHRGPASEASRTYDHIFRNWLPASGYRVDERPHFAIMGERYKKDDPGSEEEIWIPVKEINPL